MLFDPKWGSGEPDPDMPYQVGDLVAPSDEYVRCGWRGKGPGLVVKTEWPWFVRVKWHNLKRVQSMHIKFVKPHIV